MRALLPRAFPAGSRGEQAPRILIDALSARSGGGWTYLVNLLRELERDPRGLRPAVLVSEASRSRLPEARAVEIASVRTASLPSRVLFEQLLLPSRSRCFDALYCVADVAPRWKTVPTVVAFRNLNIYDRRYYDTRRVRWLERLVRFGVPGLRKAVFPSEAAAESIGSFLGIPPERRAVVPHGIDANAFRGETRVDATGAAIPYLLIPTTVERHKNVDVVLEALGRTRNPQLEAWITGSDAMDRAYGGEIREKARRLGLEKRVRLLGGVPYAEMPGLYAAAWAVVMPSLLETFGHPLLEAMCAETPLVASDLPVFREVAGKSAWYFPPTDPEALARVLDRLEGSPAERRAGIEAGRERIQEFTWRRSVDRLARVLVDAIAGSEPPVSV